MFKKKYYVNALDGIEYRVQEGLFDYVCELQRKVMELTNLNNELELKASKFEKELTAIKPIVGNAKYEPPVSKDCGECKFVIISRFSGDVVGCRRNMVCDDFRKE